MGDDVSFKRLLILPRTSTWHHKKKILFADDFLFPLACFLVSSFESSVEHNERYIGACNIIYSSYSSTENGR